MQDELKNPDKFTAEQLYNDLLQILIKEVDSEWWDKPKVENALDQMKQNIVDVLVSPHEYFSNKLEFLNFKILLDNNLIRESAEEKGNICQGLDCDLRGIYTKYIQNNFKLNNRVLSNIKKIAHDLTKGKNRKIFHILSDIDDTLYAHSSGGVAGSDKSWHDKRPYPGIKEFYKLLYQKNTLYPYDFSKYSTILSATPGGFKRNQRLDDPVIKSIMGNKYGFLHGKDTMLEGAKEVARGWIRTLTNALPKPVEDCPRCGKHFEKKGALEKHIKIHTRTNLTKKSRFLSPDPLAVAQTKIERFNTYSSLFPEYRFCFIGDNGQGDLDTGLYILKNFKDSLVCIHNVLEPTLTYKYVPKFQKEDIDDIYTVYQKKISNINKRLIFFDTYLDLAFVFYNLGYFSKDDMDQMDNAVENDLQEMIATDPSCNSLRTCAKVYPQYYNQFFCPRHRDYYNFYLKYKSQLDCIKKPWDDDS